MSLRLEALEERAVPTSGFYVTNFDDSGPGSLRQAITNANASMSPSSSISILGGAGGTVTLTSALPTLSKNITIYGSGPSIFTVTRSSDPGTPNFRIFDVAAGSTSSLTGMSITNGSVPADSGGGIHNAGSLSLSQVWIHDNSAANGGGIANDTEATLSVANSGIWNNQATGDGGGVYNKWTAYFSSTDIYSNQAQNGGGVFNVVASTLQFTSAVQVYGNSASVNGGGVYNAGDFQMTGGELHANTAGTNGGGLYTEAGTTPTLTSVEVTGNGADRGGGFYLASGLLTLSGITLSGNTATTQGAGGVFEQANGADYTAQNGCTLTDPIVPL